MPTPASPVFCDAHTHLDQYEQYDPAAIPGILERARDAGVGCILLAGTTIASTERCIALADAHPMFYAGVGIHPMQADAPVDDAAYARLEALARDNPRVVCISEVGLDYLPDSPDHRVQDQVFRAHIHLAKSLDSAHHLSLPRIPSGGVPGTAGGKGRQRRRRDALLPGQPGNGAGRH